jgi:hypothetical protein
MTIAEFKLFLYSNLLPLSTTHGHEFYTSSTGPDDDGIEVNFYPDYTFEITLDGEPVETNDCAEAAAWITAVLRTEHQPWHSLLRYSPQDK